ncbi:MAG TPA: hypothetical protein VMY88_08495 [Acidimicrobiales bacterium]|nr:hypothetical protein [Acidimicrobiales bacterium]
MSTERGSAARSARRPGKHYPPLLVASSMMLALLAVLPSALNIPQTTPSETLEYAPVPPEDQTDVPPTGNFSSLGLGSSAGLATSESSDLEVPAGGEAGGRAIKTAGTKRCVGTPPRQTEDPLSPPCVAHFEGDNGGATYQGVTRDEIRVLIIVDGFSATGSYKGDEDAPQKKYYDLAEPAKEEDHSNTRYLRAWQQYFNARFQTYGRWVHFWAYYPGERGPEARRSEAADNYAKVKPFAVVWPHEAENILDYNEVMAEKGVLTFSGLSALRAALFREYPGISWGYLPSLEEHAVSFSAFVCEKVAGKPVEFSGNQGENGAPRKYGLIYSVDPSQAFAKEFVGLVRPKVAKCGVTFAIEREQQYSDATVDTRTGPEYAAEAMAAFQGEGVTTILWMFGFETNYSKSAAAINYRPEWILAGDGSSEGIWNGQAQDQSVWGGHAVSFTLHTKTLFGGVSPPCREAYLQVDPDIPRGTLDMAQACFYYDELRQLFTGIQVAGSRLNPQTMDKGYHAIPAVPSKDPTVPACYYGPGDYTCVKDGTLVWYDAEYQDENNANTPGCWRLADGGQRYIPRGWPAGNVLAQRRDTDPCNGWLGTLHIY